MKGGKKRKEVWKTAARKGGNSKAAKERAANLVKFGITRWRERKGKK